MSRLEAREGRRRRASPRQRARAAAKPAASSRHNGKSSGGGGEESFEAPVPFEMGRGAVARFNCCSSRGRAR